MARKKRPSAGLSKKQRSVIAKKARRGEDLGKGSFAKVASKAASEYGSKESGRKVAAALMWKMQAKKKKKKSR